MLTDADKAASADALYPILSATFRAFLAAQVYHWNVIGPGFFELHRAFRKLYERLHGDLDRIAERIRALGHPVVVGGDLTVEPAVDAARMVGALVGLLDDGAATMRGAVVPEADRGTRQMLDEVLEGLELEAWKLRSWLG